MERQNLDLQSAADDLRHIKQIIENSEAEKAKVSPSNVDTNIFIQTSLMVIAFVFAGIELFTDHGITRSIVDARTSADVQFVGVLQLGLALSLLVALVYFLVSRGAKEQSQSYSEYLSFNFHYLKNLTFLSDLFVKYAVASLVILAGKPEWLATILILYLGDYLIQGRLFSFKVRESLILGGLCLTCGVLHHLAEMSSVLPVLVLFICVSLLSLARLIKMRRIYLAQA